MNGIRLSGFELIEKLGEGGMGEVWKARQLSLDRIVAVKLLPERVSKDPENLKQLIREARTTAKLKHPGIVQVYDACEQDGCFFFVMEYVAGYNVGQWLARKKVLSHKDALVIVESVAAALHYAWQAAELIHCDIKPENIMVDQDGTIKVADLGLSLTKDTQGDTRSDEIVGTPGYISPEQVLGAVSLDCRTDIYSLGCCLYQMVTGKRPFAELADHDAFEAQVSSTIPDPRDVVPGLPPQVCGLIERMLVKNRDNRLKDWGVVLSEVHRAQKGLKLATPIPEEGASTMQRKGIKLTAALMDRDEPAAGASSSARRGLLVAGGMLLLVCAGTVVWMQTRPSEPVPEIVIPSVPAVVTNGHAPDEKPVEVDQTATTDLQGGQKKGDREAALNKIRKMVDDYVAEGALADAIRWLEDYQGEWAAETASNRLVLVRDLQKQMDEKATLMAGDAEWKGLTKELSSGILAGKYSAMCSKAEAAGKDPKFLSHQGELSAISKILRDAAGVKDKIMDSFEKDIGRVITISLAHGPMVGKVIGVKDHRVTIKMADGVGEIAVGVDKLALSERLQRLETLDLPEAYLIKGMAALRDNRIEDARSFFDKTGPILAPLLTGAIQTETNSATAAPQENDAPPPETVTPELKAFAELMRRAGVLVNTYDPTTWMSLLSECRIARETAVSIERELDGYLETHGASEFVEKNPELILALQKACGKALEHPRGTAPQGSGTF